MFRSYYSWPGFCFTLTFSLGLIFYTILRVNLMYEGRYDDINNLVINNDASDDKYSNLKFEDYTFMPFINILTPNMSATEINEMLNKPVFEVDENGKKIGINMKEF